MTTDLELLKKEAEQAQALLSAQDRYNQALVEQQKQGAITQAEKEATELGENLDSKIDVFITELALAATELTAILTKLYSLEGRFTLLAKKADDISLIAQAQAGAEVRAGYHSRLAKELGMTRIDQEFISGLVTDKLKRRFGLPNPMVYNYSNLALNNLGRWLLASPYWEQIRLQLIGPSLGIQVEQQPDMTTNEIKVKPNIPNPVTNGEGKMLNFEELEKLFPALAGK